MFAARSALLLSLAICLATLFGCQLVPKNQLDSAESHNRMLLEQKNALLAENENLKTHSHRLEDQVKQAEEELAALDEQMGAEHRKADAVVHGRNEMPLSLSQSFAQLSQQREGMEFDDQTGASKLDTDVLFDRGKAEIRSDAYPLLDEFAELLKSPAARELRVMVVGHSDNPQVAKRETRELFSDNWHLANARALAVAEYLQSRGVRQEQLGMTTFGKHPSSASNRSAAERQRNHRVEIFVTGPHTPIVGWTETASDLY
jgi:flagellar motor protein MotB